MLLIALTIALFFSSVPVSLYSVTVSQHEQYWDPETEAAEYNSTMLNCFTFTMHVKQHCSPCLRKFVVAEEGLSTFNTLHFSDFRLQLYGLVNKSFLNYAGMAHFLIESQVPLF